MLLFLEKHLCAMWLLCQPTGGRIFTLPLESWVFGFCFCFHLVWSKGHQPTWYRQRDLNRVCTLRLAFTCFWETFHHHVKKSGLAYWRIRDHVAQNWAIPVEGLDCPTFQLTDMQRNHPRSSCLSWAAISVAINKAHSE